MAARAGKQLIEKKLTKSERKLVKKQARKLISLKNKEENIDISDSPTNHLVVGNGGLICGMDRNSLLTLFGRFGHIQSLFMIPGKEFSLLSYRTKNEAIDAYNNLHGCPLKFPDQVPKGSITLYLAYLMDSFDKTKFLKWDVKPVLPFQSELHPPGLKLVEKFISTDTEMKLIEFFKMESHDAEHVCNRSMKHRKVKHYGYEFIYGRNNIDKENPLDDCIPNICKSLVDKMVREGLIPWQPDQLTVNQYDAGQGIPPHIDTHSAFEDGIISLSLGSQVVMEFCHPDGKELSLILPPRSLLIMKGESRYLWTHGITPRKTDVVIDTIDNGSENLGENRDDRSNSFTLKERGFRISLTFRKILRGECDCKYPEQCDSQGFTQPCKEKSSEDAMFVPKSDSEAQVLETAHVYEVYEEIADHFSDTRHSPWPKVSKFLRELPPNSLVADVGCGNGKYLGVNKDIAMFGSDRSTNLIKICRERGHCSIVSDILSLPYRSNTFDACISIAVIHHLSTTERRANAIREILRIVKPSGLVLIYVWAQEQSKDASSIGNVVKSASSTDGCGEGDKAETQINEISFRQGLEERRSSDEKAPINVNCENVMTESLDTYDSNGLKNSTREDTFKSEDIAALNGTYSRKETEARIDDRKKIEVNDARNVFQQQDLLIPWHFRGKQEQKNKSHNSDKSANISSHGEQVYHRFYHVFVEGELEKLCSDVGGNTVVKSYHDRGNWCIVLRKS